MRRNRHRDDPGGPGKSRLGGGDSTGFGLVPRGSGEHLKKGRCVLAWVLW